MNKKSNMAIVTKKNLSLSMDAVKIEQVEISFFEISSPSGGMDMMKKYEEAENDTIETE